jgi:hypothetical protein
MAADMSSFKARLVQSLSAMGSPAVGMASLSEAGSPGGWSSSLDLGLCAGVGGLTLGGLEHSVHSMLALELDGRAAGLSRLGTPGSNYALSPSLPG